MQTEQDLEKLVHAYTPALLRYCTGLLGNEHDAQDAVQQTFIKAWQRRHTLHQGENNTRAWLYRIAYRTALDMLRAAKRAANYPTPQPLEQDPGISDELRAALNALSPPGPCPDAGAGAERHGLRRAGAHPRAARALLTHPLQPGQSQTGRHFKGG